jgi:transposase
MKRPLSAQPCRSPALQRRTGIDHHDAATREVRFNERLHAFARHWGFRPWACAPYRARTKGKDERGVVRKSFAPETSRSFQLLYP